VALVATAFLLTELYSRALDTSLQDTLEFQVETLTDLTLVRVPVDLVYGTNDPFLSKKGTTAAARLPNVTAWPVSRVDHLVRSTIAKLITRMLLVRL
jgi:hypothetical protein